MGVARKFKVMNSKNLQPRLLYPAKLSFRIEGGITPSCHHKMAVTRWPSQDGHMQMRGPASPLPRVEEADPGGG
ncbi:hypothetical protein QTO34_019201, partial [Cnephaeus nilssonii]